MINIDWKGKIGYGDIVSPICYAHNISYHLKQPVHLKFYWKWNSKFKYNNQDPETLWYRASYLFNLCNKEKTDVTLTHLFKRNLHTNHINYEWTVVGKDKFHNYWLPKKVHKAKTRLVVINSTEQNIQTLQEYGKSWKDPIASYWSDVINKISDRYEVKVVDYKTPIGELCDSLLNARGFIGYHGTAAWVARFLQTPSIIFSDGGALTKLAFFDGLVNRNKEHIDTITLNIQSHFNQLQRQIVDNRKFFVTNYRLPHETISHLYYEKN